MARNPFNNKLNKIIGGKLLRVRQRKGYSQQNVAFDLDFSPTAYSKLENGRVDFTVTRLHQLAEYFEVNMGDFLEPNIETPRQLKNIKTPEDYKKLEAQRDLLRELLEVGKKSELFEPHNVTDTFNRF